MDKLYLDRIRRLSEVKARMNDRKLRKEGLRDLDDHGYVILDEPYNQNFRTPYMGADGVVAGVREVGAHFRAYLEGHPVILNPDSALAGGWSGLLPGVGNWREADRPHHLYPLFEKFNYVFHGVGAMNHLCPDLTIGLDAGFPGLLRKVRWYREKNHPEDTAFYDAHEDFLLGLLNFISRHAEAARGMAEREEDPHTRQNLLEIAAVNEALCLREPQTLREALQFLAWFQSTDRMIMFGGAMGQLDELLRPYYEADTAAGRVDDEQAVWMIASLFYNDTHYAQIGGCAPDGRDLTSKVSFLILEAAHLIQIPTNLAIRCHDNMDERLLDQALRNIISDSYGPSFSLSWGLDPGFCRNGFPLPLARMRAKVGCNWTALPGIEYPHQDVKRLCLSKPLLLALEEMMDSGEAPCLARLEVLYIKYLKESVALAKDAIDWHMRYQSRYVPEIVLNLFCHGPIERGVDVSNGGVDIYDIACDGVGLATAADSLAAIEQFVESGEISWQELWSALQNDFAGNEPLRLKLASAARYGGGGTIGDRWAEKISRLYSKLVAGSPTPDGWRVIPGLFSHGNTDDMGRYLGATPNGRHAGAPISHSSNPDPGFAGTQFGGAAPTAKATAVARTQPGYGNSAPLQLELDPSLVSDEAGIQSLKALIKAHGKAGGTLINLNIVSKQKVLEALHDSSLHRDLVVRCSGYSAYFHSLTPGHRERIAKRMLSV